MTTLQNTWNLRALIGGYVLRQAIIVFLWAVIIAASGAILVTIGTGVARSQTTTTSDITIQSYTLQGKCYVLSFAGVSDRIVVVPHPEETAGSQIKVGALLEGATPWCETAGTSTDPAGATSGQ